MRKAPTDMNELDFVRAYDVLNESGIDWLPLVPPSMFLVVGLYLLRNRHLLRSIENRDRYRIFPYVMPTFGALFLVSLLLAMGYERYRYTTLARDQTCMHVEGFVTNFVPMPWGGHAEESFRVGNVDFSYSDYEISGAFHQSESHGGPVHANIYVRICFDPGNNKILQLDVRKSHGSQ